MHVNITVPVNGKDKSFMVDVAVAQYIGDLSQQVRMLNKVVSRIENEEKEKKDAAKPAPQKGK
jgi:hypothetical protein